VLRTFDGATYVQTNVLGGSRHGDMTKLWISSEKIMFDILKRVWLFSSSRLPMKPDFSSVYFDGSLAPAWFKLQGATFAPTLHYGAGQWLIGYDINR
jgi:hypothetical protein